jgi:hypothetical protein
MEDHGSMRMTHDALHNAGHKLVIGTKPNDVRAPQKLKLLRCLLLPALSLLGVVLNPYAVVRHCRSVCNGCAVIGAGIVNDGHLDWALRSRRIDGSAERGGVVSIRDVDADA